MRVKVEIIKHKKWDFDEEDLEKARGSVKRLIKVLKKSGSKIVFGFLNGINNSMQELIMSYYLKFFKKVEKKMKKEVKFYEFINEKDFIKVDLEFDDEKFDDFYNSIYNLRILDFIKRKKDPEKARKKLEEKFINEIQKQNKGRRILSDVKQKLKDVFDENINLTLMELCGKYFIEVKIDKIE